MPLKLRTLRAGFQRPDNRPLCTWILSVCMVIPEGGLWRNWRIDSIPLCDRLVEPPSGEFQAGRLSADGAYFCTATLSPVRNFALKSATAESVSFVRGRFTGSLRSADRSAAV